mmetsp:Transcript_25673/g.35734  ORF Transcript_25673/g.35734 Transcript_25673/m.35734 type:complete len:127 (-) Transcript_25673:589-969(-)
MHTYCRSLCVDTAVVGLIGLSKSRHPYSVMNARELATVSTKHYLRLLKRFSSVFEYISLNGSHESVSCSKTFRSLRDVHSMTSVEALCCESDLWIEGDDEDRTTGTKLGQVNGNFKLLAEEDDALC